MPPLLLEGGRSPGSGIPTRDGTQIGEGRGDIRPHPMGDPRGPKVKAWWHGREVGCVYTQK